MVYFPAGSKEDDIMAGKIAGRKRPALSNVDIQDEDERIEAKSETPDKGSQGVLGNFFKRKINEQKEMKSEKVAGDRKRDDKEIFKKKGKVVRRVAMTLAVFAILLGGAFFLQDIESLFQGLH